MPFKLPINDKLQMYFLGTSIYGAIRKSVNLYDAQVEKYIYTDKMELTKQPMLLGTKLGIVCIGTLMAPYLTPMWILKDINRLDAHIRKSPDLVSKPKDECDYLFM